MTRNMSQHVHCVWLSARQLPLLHSLALQLHSLTLQLQQLCAARYVEG